MAQSVKHLTSVQVMISQFVSSSPILGSVLTARSLELASDSVSSSLLMFCLFFSLSLSKISKTLKKEIWNLGPYRIGICILTRSSVDSHVHLKF